jgi:hypothetical protein
MSVAAISLGCGAVQPSKDRLDVSSAEFADLLEKDSYPTEISWKLMPDELDKLTTEDLAKLARQPYQSAAERDRPYMFGDEFRVDTRSEEGYRAYLTRKIHDVQFEEWGTAIRGFLENYYSVPKNTAVVINDQMGGIIEKQAEAAGIPPMWKLLGRPEPIRKPGPAEMTFYVGRTQVGSFSMDFDPNNPPSAEIIRGWIGSAVKGMTMQPDLNSLLFAQEKSQSGQSPDEATTKKSELASV